MGTLTMICWKRYANGQTDCVTEFDLQYLPCPQHGYTLGIAPAQHARLVKGLW